MNIFILVLILLLFVTGAVGLVLGRKGINRWTLVGAWLVLVSSLGFIYLAGRIAQRERVWREKIRDLESQIATVIGGPSADQTLDALSKTVRLQQRKQIAVESWRNRYWTASLFNPPSEMNDGAVIELDVSGDTEQPLNAGAELAIFAFELGEELGFLGIFAVENVKPVENKTLQLEIKPLTSPDRRDRDAWRLAKNESEFLVFEDLPTDRWAATIKPDDGTPAEQEVPLDEALAAITAGQSLPGEYWAEVTVENAAALENVNEGTTLDLDLQTADKLQQDGAVKIQRVVHRRLLVDPLTALRGTRFEKVDVPTAGIEGIRGKLTAELTSLSLMIGRIGSAKQATMRENETKQQTLTALGNDKKAWEEDLAFAGQALGRLEQRVEKTNADLADARRAVVQYRSELRELTAQIMAKSSLAGQ